MMIFSTRNRSTRSNQKKTIIFVEEGFWSLEVSITKDRTKRFNQDQNIHLKEYPYQPIILFLSTA